MGSFGDYTTALGKKIFNIVIDLFAKEIEANDLSDAEVFTIVNHYMMFNNIDITSDDWEVGIKHLIGNCIKERDFVRYGLNDPQMRTSYMFYKFVDRAILALPCIRLNNEVANKISGIYNFLSYSEILLPY